MLGREVDTDTATDHAAAAARYAEWVATAPNAQLWDEEGLLQQIYLGDATFVERMQALTSSQNANGCNTHMGSDLAFLKSKSPVPVHPITLGIRSCRFLHSGL